jgi:hypothetical protein
MSLIINHNDFDFIDSHSERNCMINGCWAMNKTGLWEWLRSYNVDPTKGYMFASDPNINAIAEKMEEEGATYRQNHSGASFAFTLRNLDYIAKNGYEAFKQMYIDVKFQREKKLQFETGGNE